MVKFLKIVEGDLGLYNLSSECDSGTVEFLSALGMQRENIK